MQHYPGPILIVDDDGDIRAVLRVLLEMDGYAVLEAEHGFAAYEVLTAHPEIACIILDLHMPVMGGRPFLELLQRDGTLAQIPVIVASASLIAAESTVQFGAVDVLKKPFDTKVLLELVERVCRKDVE